MKQKVFAFGCTICHKSFTQLKSLGEHVEKFHSNEKSKNDVKIESPPVLKEKKQKKLSPIKQSKQFDSIKNVSRVFLGFANLAAHGPVIVVWSSFRHYFGAKLSFSELRGKSMDL